MKSIIHRSKEYRQRMAAVILVYAYFINILSVMLGSTNMGIYVLALVALCAVLIFILSAKKFACVFDWKWFCVLLVVLNTSSNAMRSGNWYWVSVYLMLTILIMMLSSNTDWIQSAFWLTAILGFVHVLSTILLFILPTSFYASTLGQLWGGQPEGVASLAEGYKAGLSNHYSTNGVYCAITFMLVGTLAFIEKALFVQKRKHYICLFVLSALALLMTTKRAHLLFSLCALLGGYYFCAQGKKRNKLFYAFTIFVGIIILFYLGSMFIPILHSISVRFFETDDISTGRFVWWNQAWRLFSGNIVFGIGWLRYSEYNIYHTSVHNTYIQLLCETGIVGFSVFMLAMFGTLRNSIRTFRNTSNALPLIYRQALAFSIVMQIFVLLYCLTGNCFYDVTVFFYYIAIAISITIERYTSKTLTSCRNQT